MRRVEPALVAPLLAFLRRRRLRVVVTAITVLLLGLTGLFVSQSRPARRTASLSQELPKPAPASPASVATPESSPTQAPVEASPSASSSSSSSANDYANLGPASPGSVVVPHTAGQHSWSGVSEQITISASISPIEARVGVPVTFTVHMSGPDKNCCALYMVYGDGAVTDGVDCDRTATGGSRTETRTHTYNKSGPHHLLIQAIGNCDRNGVLYVTLDVGSGTRTSQGPELPKVQFDSSTPAPNDPYWRTVSLWGHVVDEDGYLSKLVVTFGDGTSHTFAGDPMGCRPSLDGWPSESTADLPSDPHPYWHTYGAAGHYTVTLTAYSAGCDGQEQQTARASFVWSASGPEPSPSATVSPTPSPSPSP